MTQTHPRSDQTYDLAIIGAGPSGLCLARSLADSGLAVTLILTWVFAWNEYLLAATLTNFNARTLTTGLSEYVTTTGTEWGIMAAISVFTLIPALIVFGLVQKHIVAGLTFGAVKG